ncbi:MAG: translation initiation factor IF-2 [Alphaproteobacteria bacterium]|nr:translation initiation factor IF-2 [Alphaproteobacteria bacterium]
MTNENEQTSKKLSLGGGAKLGLKPTTEAKVQQSFAHGRSKSVAFEVRKKRGAPAEVTRPAGEAPGHEPATAESSGAVRTLSSFSSQTAGPAIGGRSPSMARSKEHLTESERANRNRALLVAKRDESEAQREAELAEQQRKIEAEARAAEEARRAPESRSAAALEPQARESVTGGGMAAAESLGLQPHSAPNLSTPQVGEESEEDAGQRAKKAKPIVEVKRQVPVAKRGEPRRRGGKITVSQALDADDIAERVRSLASVRRAREREKARMKSGPQEKVFREVIIPDLITVQELSSRMAERGSDVIKSLMKMGVMATINQPIDADTAEIIVQEFGHTPKRASEAAVEVGLRGSEDRPEDQISRPPVVTVMGHVDHGKTSLLDALRKADVAAHEAGGITQHIGAYQVTLPSHAKITFIDTPGHEAFTEMRARGAEVTDIVVLVVAADDGIMPQTVEAITHAKAAGVPIVVAINKCDKPDADPKRVRTELLQHDLVVEELGGEVLAIEVSAKTRQGLDRLEEAILLQAEILDLKANPNRAAEGTVVEAKLDRRRGPVATILVQRGTLRVGDVFVAGGEWGRVRALLDDRGNGIEEAGPSVPVEVLGLQNTPLAGDELSVVESESRAREVASFRQRRRRDASISLAGRGTVEQMLSKIAAGEVKEFPVVIKTDVQGSLEAIVASLKRLGNAEVAVRILHAGVGALSESDVTLARASGALIIAFNVRPNPQAKEMARRDRVDIRYYSVIYGLVDDVKAILSGMLTPTVRENFLGYAEIRQIFEITRVGKVAGCMVTDGIVKRGSKVRLLRDNVVIHEGNLKTLRRVKDEVKEVKQGFECGMAFDNYNDIKEGDQIECFEMVEEARQL